MSGTYRALFSGFLDTPPYQRLTASARLVLLTLMACQERGPTGLFRFYPALLAERTGLPLEAIATSLEELTRDGWIAQDPEHGLLWIIDVLRTDPYHRANNANHRRAIEKALLGLPLTPLVPMFCQHYGLPIPIEGYPETLPITIPNPIPIPIPIPTYPDGFSEPSNGPGPAGSEKPAGRARTCRCGFTGDRAAVEAHTCRTPGPHP